MAQGNKNPSYKTRFKPGEVHNPNGRPKLSPEMKLLKTMTKASVARLLNRYAEMSRENLLKAIHEPLTPSFEVAIAQALLKAISTGDTAKLEWILTRAVGKPMENVQISVPKPYIIERLSGEHVELGMIEEAEAEQEKED